MENALKTLVINEHVLIDTYDFVNKINHLDAGTDRYIVSFDVESLFTNVPTLETIDLILELAFAQNNTTFHALSKDELKELLILCTQRSHFQFNGIFNDQVDGVAMGSPLGPLFAGVFMLAFEKRHMSELKAMGVRIWLRYVDDIFASFDNKEQAENVLEFINNQHPNLRFTVEHEESGRLPFLDTCVVRRINKYSTTIYRKKTFIGVYLNWTSMTARSYKIGLIRCLAERIWRICSEDDERRVELDKLKLILARNDYPTEVVESCISKFVESKTMATVAAAPTVELKPVFIKLPYVSAKCEDFAHRFKKLVSNNYPQTDFTIAFQAPMQSASCSRSRTPSRTSSSGNS